MNRQDMFYSALLIDETTVFLAFLFFLHADAQADLLLGTNFFKL